MMAIRSIEPHKNKKPNDLISLDFSITPDVDQGSDFNASAAY
jgi:chorismate mutase